MEYEQSKLCCESYQRFQWQYLCSALMIKHLIRYNFNAISCKLYLSDLILNFSKAPRSSQISLPDSIPVYDYKCINTRSVMAVIGSRFCERTGKFKLWDSRIKIKHTTVTIWLYQAVNWVNLVVRTTNGFTQKGKERRERSWACKFYSFGVSKSMQVNKQWANNANCFIGFPACVVREEGEKSEVATALRFVKRVKPNQFKDGEGPPSPKH